MAEIKIEKKKSVWPWLLLVLAILAVIVYFIFFNNNSHEAVATTDSTQATGADTSRNNGAVTAYLDYVDGGTGKMSLDHTYTSQALLKLVQAVKAKASDINYEVKADMDSANAYANEITQDPYETSHADKIRKVADMIGSTLGNMQRDKYPSLNMEANDVRQAAAGIKPDVLTLDQKEAVQSFLDKAATMLRKMNS